MTDIRRALTGSTDRPALTFERTYRATPAELHEACTSIERLAGWFGEITGAPAAVGDAFTASLSEDPDDVARGHVLRCDEDVVAVSWSWQGEPESVITARIVPVDRERTRLLLDHALTAPENVVGYGGGWEQVLQSLSRALGDAAADAPDDERIEADAVARWRTITRAPLALEYTVAAPLERVWAALSSAEGLRPWWWSHWDDVAIAADVRPGGAYRIVAPGAGVALSGTYLAVDAPEHLAFTWEWRDDDGEVPDEAVDVRLDAVEEGTRISIRHSGPWADDAPAASYREGWDFTLGQLRDALSASDLP
ncbi:MAG: SRPBCC family protein [Cellulomonadaceae bacterium]